MGVGSFVRSNPALAPLFACVGLGIVGTVFFASRTASRNADVVWNKKSNPFPWLNVNQSDNLKLMAVNQTFTSTEKRGFRG